MGAKSDPLRVYLRNLAGWTWNRQADAFQHGKGLCLHEETITEMLLLRMARDTGKHGMTIRMFSKDEEKKNGADWEWIIKTAHCFHQLRVQAKRLYHSSSAKKDYGSLDLSDTQHKRLISRARRSKKTPVYVFYNHQYGANSGLFLTHATAEFSGRSHWGCTIAHAKDVTSNKLALLMPMMKPWHDLIQPMVCGLNVAKVGAPVPHTTRSLSKADGDVKEDAPDSGSGFDESLFDQSTERQQDYLEKNALAGVAFIDFSDFRGR